MSDSESERAIREEYAEFGPEEFYQSHGSEYRNPHEQAIRSTLTHCHKRWSLDLTNVLDLACGSGEVTLAVRDLGTGHVDGIDPYTAAAYRQRTGQDALQLSFAQIAAGEWDQRQYSLIICSYALHLLEPSRLPVLLQRLAQCAPGLLVLSPHKRPVIKSDCGWRLLDEAYHQRVRARLFASAAHDPT